MPLHHRIADWSRTHPVAGNALLLLATLPVLLPINLVSPTAVIVALLLLATLLLRPLRPALSAALFAAVALIAAVGLRTWAVSVGVFAVPWLMCTVAARCPRRVRLALLVLALAVAVVIAACWPRWWLAGSSLGAAAPLSTADWAYGAVPLTLVMGLFVLSSYLLGDLHRVNLERRAAQQQRAQALAERAHRLEVERDQEVRLAAQEERARIAREMHDVVAHSLSVVIAQADGARYAARTDPAAALTALSTISSTSRGSLAEMRRLLGVLRTDEGSERTPVPSLGDLPRLLESVRATGLDVRCDGLPEVPGISPGASLAVYRLVQEALTNTLKHAPGATQAVVRLEAESTGLLVRVTSDGRRPLAVGTAAVGTAAVGIAAGADVGTAAESGGGQGLRGLAERFRLYDGDFRAGPDPADPRRWIVAASMPTRTIPTPARQETEA